MAHTTLGYNGADQLTSITTPSPAQVTTRHFDNMNRLWKQVHPDGQSVTNTYHPTGELKMTSGARTYPAGFGYDTQGRITSMTNWASLASGMGARVTLWRYDGYRGFLTNKSDSAGQGATYTYTPAGRPVTRTWARGITTTYTNNAAGEVVGIGYSDGSTPDVTLVLDRVGAISSITHGSNTTAMLYNTAYQAISESHPSGALAGLSLSNRYDGLLRRTDVEFSISGSSQYNHGYSYDAASRLASVSDGSVTATYAYLANSALVSGVTFEEGATQRLFTQRAWDNHNRLEEILSTNMIAVRFGAEYSYNSANQREAVQFPDGSSYLYQYDSLGQITAGRRSWADGTPAAGEQFTYAYDDIGNRQWAAFGGDQFGANLRHEHYTANLLNQYSEKSESGYVNVIGTATNNATVTVNNQATQRKDAHYRAELNVDNGGGAVWLGITNLAVLNQGTNDDILTNITGNLFIPQNPQVFTHDVDGNLTSDGRWTNRWDAENRLVEMTGRSDGPAGSRKSLHFEYDYAGRRISKVVSNWTGSAWARVLHEKYVYDGWNLVGVVNGTNHALIKDFMWGSDLSGSLQGAGGVGGLLAMTEDGGNTLFVAHDGNGNVTGLVRASDGTVAAEYQYGPFGELTRATGPSAFSNPFRFSTKYSDDESDLLYYGHRYYNPGTGRWLSRDPIGERGGINVYAFVANRPVQFVDKLGLDEYKLVCQKRDELEDAMSKLNPGDFRLRFLRTQSCILKSLCEGACCTSLQSTHWLNGVVGRFMDNLLDALKGEFYEKNTIWQATFNEVAALESGVGSMDRGELGNGAAAASSSLVNEGLAASRLLTTHINNDLRQALIENGVGINKDWACVGREVDRCSRKYFSGLEVWVGKHVFDKDASSIRDDMRYELFMEEGVPKYIQ